MLRRASLPVTTAPAAEPFTVREVRGAAGGTGDLLGFDLADGDRILVWNGPPLPDVECSLGLDPTRGLLLYWQSKRELKHDTDPPRTVVISPFVTRLEYLYRDGDPATWRNATTMQKTAEGHWLVPDCLKITFAHAGATAERTLTLPLGNGALPLF
jgi:hypothetical protein